MFEGLRERVEMLKRLPDQLEQYGVQVLQRSEVAEFIVGENQDQLYAGKNTDGSDIEPFYSGSTIRDKKSKGQPTDRVTLRDLGNYYEGKRAEVKGSKLEIVDTDSKSGDLQRKYGNKITGLSDSSIDRVRTYIKPDFQKFVYSYFG